MPFHLSDFFSAGTLIVVFGIYRKVSIIGYQHTLMWFDFATKKGISPNGAAKARTAVTE